MPLRMSEAEYTEFEKGRMLQSTRNSAFSSSPSRAETASDSVDFIQSGESVLLGSVLTHSEDANYRLIVVPGEPVAKPRGTQSDKWKTDDARVEKRRTRPRVKRYHDWVNEARRCAGSLPTNPQRLDVIAYFPLTTKAKHGLPHMVRPDSDNILKAVADGLFPKNDAMIHEMRIKKLYDDGRGPRVEITIY